MTKTYTFRFPDGRSLAGFTWSLLGWYTTKLPDSGIRSEPFNRISFTREAIEELGILMEEHGAICADCGEEMPHFALCVPGRTGQ